MSVDWAFNEDDYLALNPDVAAAVEAGAFASGRDHFEQYGRAECRFFISQNAASLIGRHWAHTISPPPHSPAPIGERVPDDLEKFFDERRTGPGIWKWRHYFPIYERHFAKFRGREVHFLEIGIFSGGSLDMWREYLGPQAHIYGIDIEPGCITFEGERTKIFIGDQADPKFWEEFRRQVPILDAVIDDGAHTFHEQTTSINQLLPHLRSGGVYLCEDVHGQNNPFAGYVAGMLPNLNFSDKLTPNPNDDERRLTSPTNNFQKVINSVSFYPFVVVLELNSVQPSELIAPKHGDSWKPYRITTSSQHLHSSSEHLT
jgi:hypothetical protein